jgi:hypothetical protein
MGEELIRKLLKKTKTVLSGDNSYWNERRILLLYMTVMPSFYDPKLLTPLLHHSTLNEEGGYVGGWVGSWRHLGYGVPELPPDYS